MEKTSVLIIGSGGREHAFAWKIAQSPFCEKVYVAPGNGGTEQTFTNVPINAGDFESIRDFVLKEKIGMVVVGPEDPLVNGIADFFYGEPALSHVAIIGPSKAGAQLEGSKSFAKAFMKEFAIPTAGYRTFDASNYEEGILLIAQTPPPYVLKADGLAAGKGVLICKTRAEALNGFRAMIQENAFGKAGTKVVLEEFLAGIEFSVFVLTDGISYKVLPVAKDYKRIGEGDTGLNTGGMGAVSPVNFVTESMMAKVEEQIIQPTIRGLQQSGISYKGFIYFGLINVKGEPKVIEYNCRMGDPETQVVLPRLETDLLELFHAVWNGNLENILVETTDQTAVTTVLASAGYPGDYPKGCTISMNEIADDITVFHAGTKFENGTLATSGGRVFAVTALAENLAAARKKSANGCTSIHFDGMQYRRDIGADLE